MKKTFIIKKMDGDTEIIEIEGTLEELLEFEKALLKKDKVDEGAGSNRRILNE